MATALVTDDLVHRNEVVMSPQRRALTCANADFVYIGGYLFFITEDEHGRLDDNVVYINKDAYAEMMNARGVGDMCIQPVNEFSFAEYARVQARVYSPLSDDMLRFYICSKPASINQRNDFSHGSVTIRYTVKEMFDSHGTFLPLAILDARITRLHIEREDVIAPHEIKER